MNKLKGFWNGEPCIFYPIEYTVKESNVISHWFNRFVGQKRQGLKVEYDGGNFFIDNQHGDGYYKLTKGKGSVKCGHKSINFESYTELTKDDLVTVYNTEALIKEDLIISEFWEEFDPNTYEKLQAAYRLFN